MSQKVQTFSTDKELFDFMVENDDVEVQYEGKKIGYKGGVTKDGKYIYGHSIKGKHMFFEDIKDCLTLK